MAAILLVHGACHGAWCWRDLVPELEDLGHTVSAIDLPSHGADRTPVAAVTLDLYAEAILAALDAPALVLGHSMAGFPITRAAQMDPARIRRLVYLCAFLPRAGLSLSQMRGLHSERPLETAARRDPGGVFLEFDPEEIEARFYHDCPPGTVAFARPRLCPQAIRPLETPLAAPLPDTPQSYILCEDDRAVPPALQSRLAETLAPGDIHRLPGSHSPFFARPAELARLVSQIAGAG